MIAALIEIVLGASGLVGLLMKCIGKWYPTLLLVPDEGIDGDFCNVMTYSKWPGFR